LSRCSVGACGRSAAWFAGAYLGWDGVAGEDAGYGVGGTACSAAAESMLVAASS
jgi:hypothetical protein